MAKKPSARSAPAKKKTTRKPAYSNQARDTKKKLLKDLERKSREYARKSTLLSNALEEAEEFLNEMPGKIGIEIARKIQGELYELQYQKSRGNGWRLILRVGKEENPVLLTQASVLYKSIAAQLLPELYQRLESHYRDLEARIDAGLVKLKELPFLDLSDVAVDESSGREEAASDGLKRGPDEEGLLAYYENLRLGMEGLSND